MHFELRPCRFVGGALALHQRWAPSVGRPLFAKPHAVRQRRSVAKLLCTVCGKHTPAFDRFWFQHGEFRDGLFMTVEAPVHKKCGELALGYSHTSGTWSTYLGRARSLDLIEGRGELRAQDWLFPA